MQNGPGAGMPMPHAFADYDNRKKKNQTPVEERLTSLAYFIIACLIMIFLSTQLHIKEVWITKNTSQKNEFRLGMLSIIIGIFCGIYLLFQTRTAPPKERHIRMKDDHPVAAYTMMVCALIAVLCSFLVLTYMIGPFGIIFWGALWVAFFQGALLLA